MTIHFAKLQQAEDAVKRLGRHVLHDADSFAYDARMLLERLDPAGVTHRISSVEHASVVPPWDQGQIGSCTANAAYGMLMTQPFHKAQWSFAEPDCVQLYELETRIDDRQIPGRYPSQDTGSTGLWSMKALRQLGLITGYYHAFSTNTVLRLLQRFPVSTGLAWYQSMFDVDSNNIVVYRESSGVAGGHQFLLVGYDADRQLIRARNSWGTGWADGGYFWIKLADYDALLHQQGDAVTAVIA